MSKKNEQENQKFLQCIIAKYFFSDAKHFFSEPSKNAKSIQDKHLCVSVLESSLMESLVHRNNRICLLCSAGNDYFQEELMWGDKEKHDPLLLGGFSMGNNGLHHHSHLYREFHRGMNGKSRPVVLWKGETARKKRFGWFPTDKAYYGQDLYRSVQICNGLIK
ncbi:hypothetical protein NECAME_04743 [Necator americanus]|uniref:Uncharacterized protein n=1 Tax=Necator americanus TaxID=51031 RepID=W2SQS3_NECAM|nr:hypothetical protein NECAME_04743 [Necator americanus]ETN71047.1 hypothetical protein NECAME_04743 [Necator americanus]